MSFSRFVVIWKYLLFMFSTFQFLGVWPQYFGGTSFRCPKTHLAPNYTLWTSLCQAGRVVYRSLARQLRWGSAYSSCCSRSWTRMCTTAMTYDGCTTDVQHEHANIHIEPSRTDRHLFVVVMTADTESNSTATSSVAGIITIIIIIVVIIIRCINTSTVAMAWRSRDVIESCSLIGRWCRWFSVYRVPASEFDVNELVTLKEPPMHRQSRDNSQHRGATTSRASRHKIAPPDRVARGHKGEWVCSFLTAHQHKKAI